MSVHAYNCVYNFYVAKMFNRVYASFCSKGSVIPSMNVCKIFSCVCV